MTRIIETEKLIPVIAELFITACYELNEDALCSLTSSIETEKSPYGKRVLQELVENAGYAKEQKIALCQDTGIALIFVEIAQSVSWTGMNLFDALNEGVRIGYSEGYLRKSIVSDPLLRKNTGDNTPCIVHTEIARSGTELDAKNQVKITVMPKGGGSENMSALKILSPSDGEEGIINFVLETVQNAGGKPCPPVTLGIGIGGSADTCVLLSKKALMRKIGERNKKEFYANLEKKILEKVNATGIGPMGYGGTVSAFDVHIETYPCHITSLPVAISFMCHAYRTKSIII